MSAGFHSHTHCYVSLFEFAVELLRFFWVNQASFPELTAFGIYVCNLLEARMIVTTYNQHVRLLFSEPFGWFPPSKVYSGLGADIVMESLHSLTPKKRSKSASLCNREL